MEIRTKRYDSALSLLELLSGVVPDKLSVALTILLGAPARVVSADGAWVMGNIPPLSGNVRRLPLAHDLETVGFLETSAPDEAQVRAAAVILELFMRSGARYFMASEMHLEVVKTDYEELQRRHEALIASEARYKALAESLEERVKEQVSTIASAHRQLYQAEKMASVGQLAAGVAHEINNPIGFIRSNLGTASSYVQKFRSVAEQVKSGDTVRIASAWQVADLDFILEDFPSLLQESIDGADRVARIVSDLKGFSNIDQAEEEIVDLNDSIRSACNVAANQINSRADLKLMLGELPPLRCHAGHLSQVFLNLLLNAAHAMNKRGEICIQSGVENNQIVIRISDTGSGISPEVLPHIFDPFFTTREVGSGTGLGLTVSRDILTAHGGTIEVSSELNVGTVFTIQLPIKQGNP
ncbi:MAG: two-component sensor histidine kinase [Nitrosomonadales bacterium]|nr:two-component sensor histidine kinase [Nitrosomonadales bacterium]